MYLLAELGKLSLLTPVYLSVAWVATASYQLFTATAVRTVVAYLCELLPSLRLLLLREESTIVFIHGFAWIFLVSSIIPSILLGSRRSVLLQFTVCLLLTLTPTLFRDWIEVYLAQIFAMNLLFNN
ncbi:MAG: hypothetical protein QXG97_02755, partial [Nitrososphaerota archaeon]